MQWYFLSPPSGSEPKAMGRPASRMIWRDLSPPERTTSILSNSAGPWPSALPSSHSAS